MKFRYGEHIGHKFFRKNFKVLVQKWKIYQQKRVLNTDTVFSIICQTKYAYNFTSGSQNVSKYDIRFLDNQYKILTVLLSYLKKIPDTYYIRSLEIIHKYSK